MASCPIGFSATIIATLMAADEQRFLYPSGLTGDIYNLVFFHAVVLQCAPYLEGRCETLCNIQNVVQLVMELTAIERPAAMRSNRRGSIPIWPRNGAKRYSMFLLQSLGRILTALQIHFSSFFLALFCVIRNKGKRHIFHALAATHTHTHIQTSLSST